MNHEVLFTKIEPEYEEVKHTRGTIHKCDQFRIDYVVMLPTGTSIMGQLVKPYQALLNLDEMKEQVLKDIRSVVGSSTSEERPDLGTSLESFTP